MFSPMDHFVLIVIEVEESLKLPMRSNFELDNFKIQNKERSWIVQITSNIEKSSMIFYMDVEFSHVYIADDKIINRGQFCNENYFDELVKKIMPNILRSPDLDLLKIRFTTEELRWLNENFNDKSGLCSSFLGLFDSNLEPASKKRRIETNLSQAQAKEYFEDVDHRNYNMLMLAIEQNNQYLLDALIELDFDLSHRGNDGKRAADLAIEFNNFDFFVKLLDADSLFPDGTQMNRIPKHSKAYGQVCNLIRERNNLHNFVVNGDIEIVEHFIANNFRLKCAYNLKNKSLLTSAIEHRQFSIHAFLQYKGFSKGTDPSYEEALSVLTEEEKNKIAELNLTFFHSIASEHVYALISKTKVASLKPDRNKSYEEIWKFYNDLDAIPEISVVLKVAALFENLKISFDFESSNVSKMHPSQPQNHTGAFYEGGYIYVSAANWVKDRNEVLGIIAHEFTHCAMKLVYQNGNQPFKKTDYEKGEQFCQVVENTAKIEHSEEIVSLVYSYHESCWLCELIVRVPQMLAQYKDNEEKLNELKAVFVELFSFFSTETLPDVSKYLKNNQAKEAIEALNAEAGLLQLIRNEEIEFKSKHDLENIFKNSEKHKVNVVLSNSSIHSLAEIFDFLEKSHRSYITTDLKFFVRQFQTKVQTLFESDLDPLVIINCLGQFEELGWELSEVLCMVESTHRIYLVADLEDRSKVTSVLDPNICELQHEWEDLSEVYRKKVLAKKLKFQSELLTLESLLEDDECPVLKHLPLKKVVFGAQLKVNESIAEHSSFHINRNFSIPDVSEEKFGTGKLIERVQHHRVVIIPGIAGSGKSAALKEIYKKLTLKFPYNWVSLLDLKQLGAYLGRAPLSLSFIEFCCELVLERGNTFERELFKHFFVKGKVFLLLDGFDEISPYYEDIFFNFLSKFQYEQKNQIWITTRSHQKDRLEKFFDVTAYEITSFEWTEKISFLLSFWDDGRKQNKSRQREIATMFMQKLEIFAMFSKGTFIGIPLLLKITGETYKDEVRSNNLNTESIIDNFNFYSLYRKFVNRMIFVWRHDKGSLSEQDQELIDESANAVLSVHHTLALEYFFSNESEQLELNFNYDRSVWTRQTLTRVGLIRFLTIDSKPEFLHQTFAEFLIAQYIVLNLKEQSKKMSQAITMLMKLLEKDRNVICEFVSFAFDLNEISSLDQTIISAIKTKLEDKIDWEKVVTSIVDEKISAKFFDFAIGLMTKPKFIRAFEANKSDRNNFFIKLADQKDEAKIEAFALHINQNFEQDELQKIFSTFGEKQSENIFVSAVRQDSTEGLFVLYKTVEISIGRAKIKAMLTEKDQDSFNIVGLAAGMRSKEALKELFRVLHASLDSEEICGLILAIDKFNDHCLHRSAAFNSSACLQTLLEIVGRYLSVEEQKRFLAMKGSKGRNVFLRAAFNRNRNIFGVLITIAKQLLTNSEIESLLSSKDENNFSVVSLVAEIGNYPSRQKHFKFSPIFVFENYLLGSEKALKELVEVLQAFLKPEKICQLVTEVNHENDHCLHLAVTYQSLSFLKTLFEFVKSNLSMEQMKQFLRLRGAKNKNVFGRARVNKSREVLSVLIDHAKDILDETEIKSMLVID